jgi:hypothetical protein
MVGGGTVVMRFGACCAYVRPVLARIAATATETTMRIALPPEESEG